MVLSAIPRVEDIGKPVIGEARELDKAGELEEAPQPSITRRAAPNCHRTIGTDMEHAIGVDRMEAPPDVFDISAEAGEGVGLEINVAKPDRAGSLRLEQPVLLPIDAGVTDRTLGVVPDGELGQGGHRLLRMN